MSDFKLKPMTDFVLQQQAAMYAKIENQEENSDNAVLQFITEVPNYANFLKQELKPGMFYPCDVSGKPLERPDWDSYKGYTDRFYQLENDYKEAEMKVLFKGFTYVGESSSGSIFFLREISKENEKGILKGKNVEWLITEFDEIELTEAATKKIGL